MCTPMPAIPSLRRSTSPVETGTNFPAECPEAIAEERRAADGTGGPSKLTDIVTGEVSDRSAEAHRLCLCQLVMPLEQFTPTRVAQLDRSSCGIDDVCQQHRGENSVCSVSRAGAR